MGTYQRDGQGIATASVVEIDAPRDRDEEPCLEPIVERARRVGFLLVQLETDNGQVVWEWRRGNKPRPRFLTRKVAIQWMEDRLASSSLTA